MLDLSTMKTVTIQIEDDLAMCLEDLKGECLGPVGREMTFTAWCRGLLLEGAAVRADRVGAEGFEDYLLPGKAKGGR